MKRLAIAAVIVAFTAVAYAEAKCDGGQGGDNLRNGLVAHYYKDSSEWEGNWPAGSKPQVDPKDWTFTRYSYSRVEPLINHLFINNGWFSVRWTGAITIPGKGDAVDVVFEMWADDGCRLIIDGEKLIDDWKNVDADETDSHRSATARLSPGKHKIVIEYFQGESLKKDDHDPAKLYWAIPSKNESKSVVPASAFSYTDDDLFPAPGRLDPKGDEFMDIVVQKAKDKLDKDSGQGAGGQEGDKPGKGKGRDK